MICMVGKPCPGRRSRRLTPLKRQRLARIVNASGPQGKLRLGCAWRVLAAKCERNAARRARTLGTGVRQDPFPASGRAAASTRRPAAFGRVAPGTHRSSPDRADGDCGIVAGARQTALANARIVSEGRDPRDRASRASTRDTLKRIDGRVPFRAGAARHRCEPSEMPGAVQRSRLAVIDAGGGKSVLEQADYVVVPLMEVSGRPLSVAGQHPHPEGASVSDRYPKGRDRMRARSP